jgi:GNAT superfamily N-acetyltransferase
LYLRDCSRILLPEMDSLRIRPAASGDAAPLGRLLEQLGYPTDAANIPERIEKLHARPGTMVLVAEDEHGEVLGVVTVHLFQSIHSIEPAAWLTSLVVDEEARGQGIGSALVARAEDWAIKHGALRLSLTSAFHRERAHEFYKTRDYEHTGVRLTKVFVNRLGDAPPNKGLSPRKNGAKNPRNQSRR